MILRLLIIFLLFRSVIVMAEESAAFDIFEFQVSGNTVLSSKKIEDAVYPFMGEHKTIDDVEKARAALEQVFHNDGYLTVFVNIPEQKVEHGVVSLNVLEGKVGKLRVVGSQYYSLGEIKSRVPQLAEGTVPNFPLVQQELASVNSADRRVAPVLRAGDTPGKVDVDLKVSDSLPFHGDVELNNKNSVNTTDTRLSGSIRYANLWQKDHSINLSFQVSPQNTDEVKVLSGTYLVPRQNGDFIAAYSIVSKSNVSAVGDTTVIGDGVISGIRYIHPLPSIIGLTHTFTAGVDYKDFNQSTGVQGADRVNTPISYTPFYVGYDANILGEHSNGQVSASIVFSLKGVGNNESDFNNKRYLASSNYAYLKLSGKYAEDVYKKWQISARFTAQAADGPLISNEQFAVGGYDSVRGYYESTALGDSGVYGTLELRTPSFADHFSKNISDFYALAFYDAGYTYVMDALPGQTERYHLESSGFGIYLKDWKGFFTTLDFAMAMRDAAPVKSGDARVLFRIGYNW